MFLERYSLARLCRLDLDRFRYRTVLSLVLEGVIHPVCSGCGGHLPLGSRLANCNSCKVALWRERQVRKNSDAMKKKWRQEKQRQRRFEKK